MFNKKDRELMLSIGISEEEIISQIELYKKGVPYLKLKRPCISGDGIHVISGKDVNTFNESYPERMRSRNLLKFVPASGAATRMFKTLQKFKALTYEMQRDAIVEQARHGDVEGNEFIRFIDHIGKFAFYDDLTKSMKQNGYDIESLITTGQYKKILDVLLKPEGLGYAYLPKGLLKFHQYSDETRTAFEEHLIEAVEYIVNRDKSCRLHFTISQEHRDKFEYQLKVLTSKYEKISGIRLEVEFSVQDRSTDTIAVDMENNPFKLEDGNLLFRPSGHGALLENLNNIQGDIIFIKNIDNVVPDRLKEPTVVWKRVLGAYLVYTQNKIFSYLKQLENPSVPEKLLDEILAFCKNELCILPPEDTSLNTKIKKTTFLIKKLNRPLRVCGMVKNRDEVGGGPFWVSMDDGTLSLQIVESAQIDPEDEEQQTLYNSSTHYNPVDIVCGVRNYRGVRFDLRDFINPEAVFIAVKSKDGHDLKTLERPGLWNGSMSDWITIFIEVPEITFNPVKTVNDLLRSEHQTRSQ